MFLHLKIQNSCFDNYRKALLSGIERATTSSLKNVHSSHDNVKQTFKLLWSFQENKIFPAQMLTSKQLMITMTTNYVLFLFHEEDQVNIIIRCRSEKAVLHLLLGSSSR